MCSTCPLFNFMLNILLSQSHCARASFPSSILLCLIFAFVHFISPPFLHGNSGTFVYLRCIPVKFYLNFFFLSKMSIDRQQATRTQTIWKSLTKAKRQSGMANEHWCGCINWIIESSIGKVNKYTQIITSNVYNGHFESNLISHCAFSGPFSSPSLLIHSPNRMRVGRWLTFYLRNKIHFIFCLNQCDALRRMICKGIIFNNYYYWYYLNGGGLL